MVRKLILFLIIALGFGSIASGAPPIFPDKPIEIIVSAAPGTVLDLVSRAIARVLQEERFIKVPVILTNVPGGSGAVALADAVGRLKANPYTLVAFSPATTVQIVNAHTPYTYGNVTPIAALAADYTLLAVARDSTITGLQNFLMRMKQAPSAISVGGPSSQGGIEHLTFAKVAKVADIDPEKVQYNAFPNDRVALAALRAGAFSVLVTRASSAIPRLERRELRGLAVLSERRLSGLFEGIPTAIEQGVDVTAIIWYGIYGPPGMPSQVVREWETILGRMSASKAWGRALEELQLFPFVHVGGRFRLFLNQDTRILEILTQELGLIKKVGNPYIIPDRLQRLAVSIDAYRNYGLMDKSTDMSLYYDLLTAVAVMAAERARSQGRNPVNEDYTLMLYLTCQPGDPPKSASTVQEMLGIRQRLVQRAHIDPSKRAEIVRRMKPLLLSLPAVDVRETLNARGLDVLLEVSGLR